MGNSVLNQAPMENKIFRGHGWTTEPWVHGTREKWQQFQSSKSTSAQVTRPISPKIWNLEIPTWVVPVSAPSLGHLKQFYVHTCCWICPACTTICSVELLLFAVYCSMIPPSYSPGHGELHSGDPRRLQNALLLERLEKRLSEIVNRSLTIWLTSMTSCCASFVRQLGKRTGNVHFALTWIYDYMPHSHRNAIWRVLKVLFVISYWQPYLSILPVVQHTHLRNTH